ncbi:MAG: radical SAM protein [Ignavibacteriae bacterium]|nr:radical SAM protein [Ignavibacteriota bacterium]NOG96468.1 radical SAM protein [Ignavibacteriota bacterium]
MNNLKHIFGPVPSRRLGISLGIDLVPHKVCTLNCVYCEVGATTKLTIDRDEYVSYKDVLNEIELKLSDLPKLDYITFSGAGEPTLNSRIGDIINYIKNNYPQYKLALLTNGTLFYDKEVRSDCLKSDLIIPSLDAVTDRTFRLINRPYHSLKNEKIIDGLVKLRSEFKNQIWLEVFIIPGMNDNEEELNLLKKNIMNIQPDKVQLNSLDRPGVEEWVQSVDAVKMEEIKNKLKPLPVEIIFRNKNSKRNTAYQKEKESLIISTIRRRPCSLNDLRSITGLKINEINKYLKPLMNNNTVLTKRINNELFYSAVIK